MTVKQTQMKPRKEAVVVQSGSGWVKVLRFETRGRQLVLSKCVAEKVDAETAIPKVVASLFSQRQLGKVPVIGVIARPEINTRLLELPSTDPAEIDEMVDLQAARLTPYSRDEILTGYRVLGRTRSATYTKLMLAIVQRSAARDRLHHFESSDRPVERVTVSTEGLLQWALLTLPDAKGKAGVAVLDIDARSSELALFQNGLLQLSKSIRNGAEQLGDEASHQALATAVAQALAGYRGESGFDAPDRLVVTGANVGGVLKALTSTLSLPVERVEPTEAVSLGKGVDRETLGDLHASLASLVGAAACPDALALDLVPDSVKKRRELKQRSAALKRVASLLLCCLTAGALYAFLLLAFRFKEVSALRDELALTASSVDQIEQRTQVMRGVRARMDLTFGPINVLHDLHQRVLEDVYIEFFSLDETAGVVKLVGTGGERKDIQRFIASLAASPLLKRVKETGRREMNADKRYQFDLLCQLEGSR
jgi:Tfp pilus assembly PilM family ATPase/Tfp pilus assembly protein PilN